MSARETLNIGLLALIVACQTAAQPPGKHTHAALRTYVNPSLGITFRYPREFRSRTVPETDSRGHTAAVTFSTDPASSEHADETPHFSVEYDRHPMTQQTFGVEYAPTGFQDIPPKLVHFGRTRAWYYGEGGGGVYYPDQSFVRRGSGFVRFEFYGPIQNNASGKGPGASTKTLERIVLSSLRLSH